MASIYHLVALIFYFIAQIVRLMASVGVLSSGFNSLPTGLNFLSHGVDVHLVASMFLLTALTFYPAPSIYCILALYIISWPRCINLLLIYHLITLTYHLVASILHDFDFVIFPLMVF